MEEIKEINIDDLCRLCLTRKSSSTSFMKMAEVHLKLFQEITNQNVNLKYCEIQFNLFLNHFQLPLTQNYPQYACLQCCVDMEKFYNYK